MNLIFDLDGTVSDPSVGIVNSILYALEKHKQPLISEQDCLKYIGPPLTEIFADILGAESPLIPAVIDSYREHYRAIGWRENELYPNITEVLTKLRERGHQLHIATYKSQKGATKVIRHFELEPLFTSINGCGIEKSKTQLIREMKAVGHGADHDWMIGDRGTDVEAGANNNLRTIGATWGFGSDEELSQSDKLLSEPAQLLSVPF